MVQILGNGAHVCMCVSVHVQINAITTGKERGGLAKTYGEQRDEVRIGQAGRVGQVLEGLLV